MKSRQMVLPHCTWDKFGELLAESGGRSLGLLNYKSQTLESTRIFSSCLLERPKHAKLVNITNLSVP